MTDQVLNFISNLFYYDSDIITFLQGDILRIIAPYITKDHGHFVTEKIIFNEKDKERFVNIVKTIQIGVRKKKTFLARFSGQIQSINGKYFFFGKEIFLTKFSEKNKDELCWTIMRGPGIYGLFRGSKDVTEKELQELKFDIIEDKIEKFQNELLELKKKEKELLGKIREEKRSRLPITLYTIELHSSPSNGYSRKVQKRGVFTTIFEAQKWIPKENSFYNRSKTLFFHFEIGVFSVEEFSQLSMKYPENFDIDRMNEEVKITDFCFCEHCNLVEDCERENISLKRVI